MYQRILVPVEHSSTTSGLAPRSQTARTCNNASIVLIHVADGWAARNINQLDLRESEEIGATASTSKRSPTIWRRTATS